jgi:lycopene cyclase domain-containing protein
MALYTTLLLIAISAPLVLSFDKRVHFYTHWPSVMPSIFIIAVFYIVIDVYFTHIGVWGFNPDYHSKLMIFKLPLDEWLFFIVVPYASIFLHYVLKEYFPNMQLRNQISQKLTYVLLLFFVLILVFNMSKLYTSYASLLMILTLVLSLLDKAHTISRFYISFLFVLIPFILMNSILTGSFIHSEVVWYNNEENLGIRLLTIPIEDFAYGFSLLQLNLLLITRFSKIKD